IPLIISLLCLNEMVINIIFGEKWHLSSSILVWLAPTAIIQSILSTTGIIFMSQGRTGILVLLGVQGAILTGIAFVIGVNDNIISLAKYYFIANLVHFFP
ncbi:TPA: flippase, partial [Shigella boydii]